MKNKKPLATPHSDGGWAIQSFRENLADFSQEITSETISKKVIEGWFFGIGIVGFIVFVVLYFSHIPQSIQFINIAVTCLFISVTAKYAMTTKEALNQTSKAIAISEETRIDLKKPVLTFRWRYDKEANKTTEGIVRAKLTTRLVNVGSGPAVNIHVFSNFNDYATGLAPDIFDELRAWSNNSFIFSSVLGPDTGDPSMQIAFYESEWENDPDQCFSPLHDYNVIFLAIYEDLFGRVFTSMQSHKQNEVYQIEKSQIKPLLDYYSEVAHQVYKESSKFPATIPIVPIG